MSKTKKNNDALKSESKVQSKPTPVRILKHYKQSIPKKRDNQKKKAITLLSDKLCSCIYRLKKERKKNKKEATAICMHSVLKKKGLKPHSYTCNPKSKLKVSF